MHNCSYFCDLFELFKMKVLNYALQNNLNYNICIRKEAGFCSVTYSNLVPDGQYYPFQIVNADGKIVYQFNYMKLRTYSMDVRLALKYIVAYFCKLYIFKSQRRGTYYCLVVKPVWVYATVLMTTFS